ncbi:hypothetical protein AB0442_41650 [Kitasatospora sp. NPDC085895]|uniref:hypothetical protein n=1 Tax=Kitasatospora sp. NPDC085895 TaxID=3155057 RepID=UPI00344DB6FC
MTSYKIARQRHIGDALYELQSLGLVTRWHGEYVYPPGKSSTAIWWITLPAAPEGWLETAQAELLIAALFSGRRIPWKPVPWPFGESQRLQVVAEIEELRRRPEMG